MASDLCGESVVLAETMKPSLLPQLRREVLRRWLQLLGQCCLNEANGDLRHVVDASA